MERTFANGGSQSLDRVRDCRQNWVHKILCMEGVHMSYRYGVIAIAVSAAIAFSAKYASGQEYSARLNGFDELGGLSDQTGMNSGAILTKGTGEFKLHLDKGSSTATYQLTFSDLTSTATMAHIH